jgi:6-phosphogluconolactonase
MADRELVVAEDLAAAAVGVFTAVAPRTVALAGGTTPRAFYEALAEVGHEWQGTEVFFGDERCVPPDHPDSNHRMAHEALLSKIDARVHRMPGESCDPGAYERTLAEVLGDHAPALDLVVLGLGEDGHTASLFPGDPAVDERERWVARVERPDHPRLTLTLPVLGAAQLVLFLVAGGSKREALGRLLAGEDIPAGRVEARRVVILADPDASPIRRPRPGASR